MNCNTNVFPVYLSNRKLPAQSALCITFMYWLKVHRVKFGTKLERHVQVSSIIEIAMTPHLAKVKALAACIVHAGCKA